MNCEKVADHIVRWMAAYLTESHANGYAVGISGGIDSALTSTLAAMTGRRCLIVTLPIHQAAAQVERAAAHRRWLESRFANVDAVDADLTAAYDTFVASMPAVDRPAVRELAGANARARLRMTALYYVASSAGLLVAGTGNKVEDFGIGFFTKYGDGGVDISPIGDLTKTEVYRLAAWLGIEGSILEAAPTDGLFGDERTDEQQIGATYCELERAMERHSAGVRPESLAGREREVMEIYLRRNAANRHKMQLPPVCVVPAGLKE